MTASAARPTASKSHSPLAPGAGPRRRWYIVGLAPDGRTRALPAGRDPAEADLRRRDAIWAGWRETELIGLPDWTDEEAERRAVAEARAEAELRGFAPEREALLPPSYWQGRGY